MEETVVVASRIEEKPSKTAGTSSALTAQELLDSGATNLVEAFKYEPGVSIPFDFAGSDALVPFLSGGSQGVNIRGLEGNRVSINIDGIRQPEDFVVNAFEGAGGPGRIYFDPAIFSQIELFKSAASSLFGSGAIGGAVSGRTETALTLLGPELDGFLLHDSTTYSSVNESINNRFATAFGDGTYAASFLHSYRNGHESANNSPIEPNPVDFESNAFLTTLNWRPNDEWLFTLTGDYYRLDSFSDLNTVELQPGDFVTSANSRERLRFSFDTTHSPANNLAYDTLQTNLYWQQSIASTGNIQDVLLTPGRFNDIDYETTITGIQLQANKAVSNHILSYGLESSYSRVESNFVRTTFDIIREDRIGMAPSDVYRVGGFFRDEILLGEDEQWQLTPALRLDQYSVRPDNTAAFLARTLNSSGESVPAPDYDNFFLSPSLSLLYNFNDELNAYATWSQGVRNPSAEELAGAFTHGSDFITLPNPDLKEERSNSFEIGLQYTSPTLNAHASAYYNLYNDFLENNVLVFDNPDPNQPDETTTVNRGDVQIYGFELSADWLVGETFSSFEGLGIGGSFSYTQGNASARADSLDRSDQPLNSVDPAKAVAYLAYNAPEEKWGSRLTATYSAAKDDSDIDFTGNIEFLPAESWFTLDLTGYYAINDNLRLRGGITNLLDEQYVLWSTARRGNGHGFTGLPTSFFSQPGRTFFVAFDLTF